MRSRKLFDLKPPAAAALALLAPTGIALATDYYVDPSGAGGAFTTGHLLDEHCRAALATEDVGRMLSPAEAAALLERFERASARKPPAPSISRQSRQARRAETG